MKAYLISGLAADERVFRRLKLPDSYQPVHLNWIEPLYNETLSAYAIRMAERIQKEEPFILMGLSFGGMLAVEMTNFLNPRQVIIISSIPVSSHLPSYYRLGGTLQLHRILPVSFFQKAAMLKRLFTKEKNEDKNMLRNMIRNSNPHFIRWALKAILDWEKSSVSDGIIHIHGSKDAILPVRYTNPSFVIPDGGHMMVLTQAGAINRILQQVLS